MIDFDRLFLEKVVIHQVGNKVRDEGYQLSKEIDTVEDENLKLILERYFLNLFGNKDTYHFYHDSDIELNEVFHFSDKIFKDSSSFYTHSINILKHLYNTSSHPNIKSGDFYMAYFGDSENEMNVIGIFKAENKDTFLKVNETAGNFSFSYQKGLNLNKLDKGCLITNQKDSSEFEVFIIDSLSKTDNNIAKYWEIDFLNVKRYQNDDFQTKELLKISNDFSKKIYDKKLDKSPEEIFEFKKRAHDYIQHNEAFENQKFMENIFECERDKKSFIDFKQNYEDTNNLSPIEGFEIAKKVVEKSKKNITSKIKLDTGVSLQVSNFKCVEDGYDPERQMKYIKVFYNSKI